MTKLYNTQTEITNKIREFSKNNVPNLRKTQLNIIPEILFGMISSESVVSSDIAKCLKNEFSFIQLESIQRRIEVIRSLLVELFTSFCPGFIGVYTKLSVNQFIIIGSLILPLPDT